MSKVGLLGCLAGWLARVPVRVYHNHGMAMLAGTGLRRRILKGVEWSANRFATDVLFCSPSTRRAALAEGVALAGRSRVLGSGTISGVDVEKFSPQAGAPLRAARRAKWGIGADKVVVGLVGRFVRQKGLATLFEAWGRLDGRVRAKAVLVLQGGDADEQTQALVDAALADNDDVILGEWTTEMVSAYSGMDVLVLPSLYEGFPYSVLEAQAMGLPVVVTRATGNVDAVEDGATGLTGPVNDPSSLAGAISRLVDSPEQRRRLGARARSRVVSRFSKDEVLRNMLSFYETVTDRPGAGRRGAPAPR